MRNFLPILCFLVLACEKPQPQPDPFPAPVPATCPIGSYPDHFSQQCVRHPMSPATPVRPIMPAAPVPPSHGIRFGISTRGKPGISLGQGFGLHIDHKGRVGLGFGF